MRIYQTDGYRDMSRKTANIISAQIILKPDCVLGLATGSTPVGTYDQLVEWYQKGDLDFSEVRTVNLDEYKGLDHENDQGFCIGHSYFCNIPNGKAESDAEECEAYDRLIRQLGGIDLQLLGLGHNGHIGFNEPSDTFTRTTHLVDLQLSTIEANKRFFSSIDLVPRQAYTMGIGTILQAKKILIAVSGKDKAEIVRRAFFGPVTASVPASILQLHPDVTLVADEDALSLSGDSIG